MSHYETKHAAEIRDEIMAHHFGPESSALPPSEPQGTRERSRLATGSLPVSSVNKIVLAWEKKRDDLTARAGVDELFESGRDRATRDRLRASDINSCIQEMRAEIVRAIARQPAENQSITIFTPP